MTFYTALQRDYLYLLEYDSSVSEFHTKPFSVTVANKGRIVPDFHIIKEDREVLVDCFYARRLSHPSVQKRVHALEQWCHERQVQYMTITDEELWGDYTLPNVRHLHLFSAYPVDSAFQARVLKYLTEMGAVQIRDLLLAGGSAGPQWAMSSLLRMAWDHLLILEIAEAPISLATVARS